MLLEIIYGMGMEDGICVNGKLITSKSLYTYLKPIHNTKGKYFDNRSTFVGKDISLSCG